MNAPHTGVLLINLGTPEAPRTKEVRRYLRQFLSDPRVIDISALGRWLLLNLIILPFRPAKSAEAYAKIWTPAGSPLFVFTRELVVKVRALLGSDYAVEVAMRYGQPSIASAVKRLRDAGVSRIVALPLYPQYAASSTASSLDELYRVLALEWNVVPVTVLPAFFDHKGFIECFVALGNEAWATSGRPEHVLFSFHGLPERQIKKSDSSGAHCLTATNCCDKPCVENRFCYRAQCFTTARLIAQRLGLTQEQYTVCFQSRLGRTPWIKPYTDEVIPALAQRGIKTVAVYSPAFVADCLETLEEIGMRAAESFKQAQGKTLTLITSLNARDDWAKVVTEMILDNNRGVK